MRQPGVTAVTITLILEIKKGNIQQPDRPLQPRNT